MATNPRGSNQSDRPPGDAAQATIQPRENILELNPGQPFNESIVVTPPRTATMDDCCRIEGLLFGGPPSSGKLPLTIGFLEIVSSQEVVVTAVYTASDLKSGSLSIDVEEARARRVQ